MKPTWTSVFGSARAIGFLMCHLNEQSPFGLATFFVFLVIFSYFTVPAAPPRVLSGKSSARGSVHPSYGAPLARWLITGKDRVEPMSHSNEARATNPLPRALRIARKLAVIVIGASVLMFGAALIVLPGPAVVVIPAGLAILATECVWARRLLGHLKARAAQVLGHPKAESKSP